MPKRMKAMEKAEGMAGELQKKADKLQAAMPKKEAKDEEDWCQEMEDRIVVLKEKLGKVIA